MRFSKRKRNKSLSKTDIKSTEIEAMVLQHSVSQLSPNHFQHSNDSIGRKFFAGSRFSEAPDPSLIPKPPKHWISANESDVDPMDRIQTMDRLQTLTTNVINNHIVKDSSLNPSDTKRNKSVDIIGLKLLQILETNSIVNTSLNYENTRLLVKK